MDTNPVDGEEYQDKNHRRKTQIPPESVSDEESLFLSGFCFSVIILTMCRSSNEPGAWKIKVSGPYFLIN